LRIWDGINTAVKDIQEKEYSIALYPNPSVHSNTLLISLTNPQNLKINLFDMQGKLLRSVYDGEVQTGENTYTNDVSHLSSGIYFYHLQGQDFSRTIKFIKF
jgi:hypothetical protein